MNEESIMAESVQTEHEPAQRISGREMDLRQSMSDGRLSTWAQLASAKAHRSRVSGKAVSVQQFGGTGEVALIVMILGYKVMVPFCEVYEEDPIRDAASSQERTTRETQMLTKLIGAEITVLIAGMTRSGDGYAIAASRKAASRQLRHQYFHRDGDGKAAVNPGDTVDARIVSVGRYAMQVCVYGFDVVLALFNITCRYAQDLGELYSPGDVFPVEIVETGYGEDGEISRLVVSGRRAECARLLRENLGKVQQGMYCKAIITSIGQKKNAARPLFYLYLEDLDLPAIAYNVHMNAVRGTLEHGDTVIFAVNGITEANVIIGSIIRKA